MVIKQKWLINKLPLLQYVMAWNSFPESNMQNIIPNAIGSYLAFRRDIYDSRTQNTIKHLQWSILQK